MIPANNITLIKNQLNRSWLKWMIKILVSGLCLWYIFHKISINQFKTAFLSVDYVWFIVAVMAFVLSKFIASFRLNYYFQQINIRLTNQQHLQLYALGMFYNQFLPGSIGGDAYKTVRLHRSFPSTTLKKIGFAVFFDRISGLIFLAMFAALCYAILFPGNYLSYLLPIATLLPLLVLYMIWKWKFPEFLPVYMVTNLSGALVQVMQVACMLSLYQSIHSSAPVMACVFIFLVSSVVAVFPFTVGGLGARELVFLWGSQWLHYPQGEAITLSVLFYFTSLISSGLGFPFIWKDPLHAKQRTHEQA